MEADYGAIHACSDKTSARLLSGTAKRVHFYAKRHIFGMTFCRVRFVFIHIVGSTFIFNIFMGQSSFC